LIATEGLPAASVAVTAAAVDPEAASLGLAGGDRGLAADRLFAAAMPTTTTQTTRLSLSKFNGSRNLKCIQTERIFYKYK